MICSFVHFDFRIQSSCGERRAAKTVNYTLDSFPGRAADAFSRRIVGWRATTTLRTDLALDALEQALYDRSLDGPLAQPLVHHSDRGVEPEFNRSSQHRCVKLPSEMYPRPPLACATRVLCAAAC